MKGIWIPVELMVLDLTWTKRILLAEISQLEMLDKGCVATNEHFASKLKLTKTAISKALNELARDKFITIDNAQTKRNYGRKITIHHSKSDIHHSKSDIHHSKSPIHHSGESKENKTINKTINNSYSFFLSVLKEKSPIKSKITKTKEGEKLFEQIENKEQLMIDYINHQKEQKEFSKRITAFMEDYDFHKSNSTNNSNDDLLSEWSE